MVALLPLSDEVDIQALWNGLLDVTACSTTASAGHENGNNNSGQGMMDVEIEAQAALHTLAPTTTSLQDRRNIAFTFLPPPVDRSDALAVVEVGRAADVVVCALPGEPCAVAVDEDGKMALAVLRAMGLPSPVAVVQTAMLSLKDRSAAKKRAAEAFLSEIPGDHRIFAADSSADFKQIIRHLADSPHPLPHWRRQRSQVVVQSAEYHADTSNLVLAGFVRGQGLSAAQALHIPTAGDFQIEKIQVVAQHHHSSKIHSNGTMASMMESEHAGVVAQVPVDQRESLVRENDVDVLDAEQTWPTEEELKEAQMATQRQRKRRLPKGTSEYQASWILDDDDDEDDDHNEEEDDDKMNEAVPDLEPIDDDQVPWAVDEEDDEDDDKDGKTTVTTTMDWHDDEEDDDENKYRQLLEERESEKTKRVDETDEMQFPDEVETPLDVPARQRFARYRGLKSFRASPWDPKEDLPQDYARVFAFENFKRTMKKAKQAVGGGRGVAPEVGVLAGSFVNIFVSNVSAEAAERVVARVQASFPSIDGNDAPATAPPLTVFGLLQHECKLSVVNFSIRKASRTYTEPLANKEELLFVTGLRSFSARPVYSSDEHGADKHKMERFLLEGRPCVATVFAPISYPPLPLLAFKPTPTGTFVLAATGSLRDCNPDRVVLKKIVLSGYPVRAHKSKAVVRWMFHTPEDVRWFRPVELWTKQGRRGRIREPVGTHGRMKCIFDGPIGQQDSVCMSLYKRAYPKWPLDMKFAS